MFRVLHGGTLHGFEQMGEEENRGGGGHRVVNIACMISHQGFCRANESNLAL